MRMGIRARNPPFLRIRFVLFDLWFLNEPLSTRARPISSYGGGALHRALLHPYVAGSSLRRRAPLKSHVLRLRRVTSEPAVMVAQLSPSQAGSCLFECHSLGNVGASLIIQDA